MTPDASTRLAPWLAEQRWFAAGDEPPTIAAVESFHLGATPAAVRVELVTLADGARYQLVRAGSAPDQAGRPDVARALGAFVASGATIHGDGEGGATLEATWVGPDPIGSGADRALGAEQSNTSVQLGGTHVSKVLRRVHAGVHPEVEIGRHLGGARDTPVPELSGWYERVSPDGERTVLGVVHTLVPAALDGWGLVLSALAGDPNRVLPLVHSLGDAVARLHGALARPSGDGIDGDGSDGDGFGRRPLEATSIWALADRVLADPMLPPDGHRAVAHAVEAIGADAGAAIRIHGDLHLGQTLHGSDGWMILDFEGEPGRPLEQRRTPTSALRDVAGMLRSLSYAHAAFARTGGVLTPGWEAGARAAFLDGYLGSVAPELLPVGAASVHHLLTLYELEKVLYEVEYERAHRPEWIPIALAGVDRIVARGLR